MTEVVRDDMGASEWRQWELKPVVSQTDAGREEIRLLKSTALGNGGGGLETRPVSSGVRDTRRRTCWEGASFRTQGIVVIGWGAGVVARVLTLLLCFFLFAVNND